MLVDLSTKTALAGEEAWVPPTFYFGEAITLGLRLAENVFGTLVENDATIHAVAVCIGDEDARPESGRWALQIGSGAQSSANTTAPVDHDCSALELAAAINAKTAITTAYGAPSVTKADGSWIIVMGAGAVQVPMQVRDNTLFPISRGRISAAPVDEVWQHEVRLQQIPVASTSDAERVLPPPPEITLLVTGSTSGIYAVNAIQRLYVPPQFRATYVLVQGAARTAKLSQADNAETIQAALEAVLGTGNIVVTNPAQFSFDIEFTGDLKGTPQEEMEVLALDPPPGDLTFTLELDRAPLLARLRRAAEVRLPLEVRLEMPDENAVQRWRVAFRQDVTIRRPVVWPEWATAPDIDLLRPASPRDYRLYNAGNHLVAHQFYREVLGDGMATTFVVDHALETHDYFVWLRENTTGGRQLVQGVDFAVEDTDDMSIEVTVLGSESPAVNEWVVFVVSAQTVAAFANDLEIEIDQVTDLRAELDALGAAVAALQALTASQPLLRTDELKPQEFQLPERALMFPGRFKTLPDPKIGKLKAGGLIPANHDATVTSLTALPLPDATATEGSVFHNNTGAAILLPGGLGRAGASVAVAGYFASDGRVLYRVTRDGSTNSYFPTDFEQELWRIAVNDRMLRAGLALRIDCEAQLQMLVAASNMRCRLVIEIGTATSQTTPSPTGTNLEAITWGATPLLTQIVEITDLQQKLPYGCAVLRAANGTLTATRSLYGASDAAAATPATANFLLRARLVAFDTENNAVGAKGLIYVTSNGVAEIS